MTVEPACGEVWFGTRMKWAWVQLVLVAAGWSAGFPARAAESPIGRWAGVARVAEEKTDVIVDIHPNRASLSLPGVGALDWPAQSTRMTDDGIHLEFASDSGLQRMDLLLEGGKLRGTWSDPRFEEVARIAFDRAAAEASTRERRVLVPTRTGHLGASLLLPEGDGPFPGIVFLHGSGPQPRDASRFHARELARRGIAALIFDKRGVGESTGSYLDARFDDLAADAVAAATWLQSQPSIAHVGFYGHSQGGWIAPLAASQWPATAFVIASAGPLVSPMRESQWGVVRKMRQVGANQAAIERARAAITGWYAAMASRNWAGFDASMRSLRREPWFDASGLADFAAHPDAAQAHRYLLNHDYDPLPALRTMRAPALWILSSDDESIDAMETAGLLQREISEGRDIRLTLYSGFDHALRRLGSGGVPLRWPTLPEDLFDLQAEFCRDVSAEGQ